MQIAVIDPVCDTLQETCWNEQILKILASLIIIVTLLYSLCPTNNYFDTVPVHLWMFCSVKTESL